MSNYREEREVIVSFVITTFGQHKKGEGERKRNVIRLKMTLK